MSIISFGAGVNSTAMIIMLVKQGWHGPIVFADTETEWPETYCFLDYFETEWLKSYGLELTRLAGEYRGHVGGRDARPLVDFCEAHAVTPFLGTRWCTQGWKTDIINAWCKEHGETEQYIAIASDEAWRQPLRIRPLVDANIDREGCIKLIEAEGLSVPHKSSCYICPMQRYSQWRELHKNHPELFERAAHLEELSTERRKNKDGGKTILMADGRHSLRELEVMFSQGSLFDDTEMDAMQRYRPCLCAL